MKYIKLFESDSIDMKEWRDIIDRHFGYVFDLAESHSIDLGELGDEKDHYHFYDNNDGAFFDSEAYRIDIEHNFYHYSTFEDFVKYKNLLDELENALYEIKEYKPSHIRFQEDSNARISVIIKP